MTYLRGLDADTVLTPYARQIKAAGFDYVGRYLKNVTPAEVNALHVAGLGVWLIYETTAKRAFYGDPAGREDGLAAKQQAMALGVPSGTTIFATVDTDPAAYSGGLAQALALIRAYMQAFAQSLGANYHLGIYASGDVLSGNYDIAIPWLAGAMGWSGSRAYDATNKWALKQGPDFGGRSVNWAGLNWPSMPFDYDPNLIVAGTSFGAWLPSGTAPAPHPTPQVVMAPVSVLPDLAAAQAELGVTADGVWGPETDAAFAQHYGG